MKKLLNKKHVSPIVFLILFCFKVSIVTSQTDSISTKVKEKKFSLKVLKDSLDGKLDMSVH